MNKFILKKDCALAKEGSVVEELYRTVRNIYVAEEDANNSITIPIDEKDEWLELIES